MLNNLNIISISVVVVVLLFINEFYAHPSRRYQLLCEDGSDAIDKDLHACCPTYCVLCARFNAIYKRNCVTNCTGTVQRIQPFCNDCFCKPREISQNRVGEGEKEEEEERKICPFMNKMK